MTGKTFCILPFTHLQLRNGGTFGMCCHAPGAIKKDDGSNFIFGEDGAEDVFNSNYMRSARASMLEGRPVADCRLCYKQEKIAGGSYRRFSNKTWLAELDTSEEAIRESHSEPIEYRPTSLHLNLGNLCNLRCRMCWSGNSSEIEADPVHSKWAPPPSDEKQSVREKKGFFKDHKAQVEDLLGDVASVREIYFTGGEPLLMPSVNDALQYLIDHGVAGNIHVKLNTNATAASRDTISLLKKFRRLTINLSLDGIGECYEYIRYPARWSKVEANIARLQEEFPDATFHACPTIQIYNVFNLVEMCDFCEARGIVLNAQPLYAPLYLAVTVLPQRIREHAATQLEAAALLPTIQAHLRKAPSTASDEIMEKFMRFTNDLDKTRGQDFRTTHRAVADALANSGINWIDELRFAEA